jgi:hypothetical protein
MSYKVEPKEIIEVLNIHAVMINVSQLIMGQEANIQVAFVNDKDLVVKVDGFVLKQPEYDEWVSDEWLVDYVCKKYELVRKE